MTESFWQEFLDQQADLSGPVANLVEKNVQFFSFSSFLPKIAI